MIVARARVWNIVGGSVAFEKGVNVGAGRWLSSVEAAVAVAVSP